MNQNFENESNSPLVYRERKGRGCGWFAFGCLCAPIFGIILLAVIAILAINFASSECPAQNYTPSDHFQHFVQGNKSSLNAIAVVPITGVILSSYDGEPLFASNVAIAQSIIKQLDMALSDDNIKGIVVLIDSPGGEVVASDLIYRKILEVRKKKPVAAYMASMAASGGFYVSLPCKPVIAHEYTITGSIGVILSGVKYYNLLNKIGVESETYTSGNKKDILSPVRPTTPEEQQIIRTCLDVVYNRFLNLVVDNREGFSADSIRQQPFADGRILDAPQAQKFGLIDSIGYFDDAVKAVAESAELPENDYKVIRFDKIFHFSDLLGLLESRAPQQPVKVEFPGMKTGELPQGRMYFLPESFSN